MKKIALVVSLIASVLFLAGCAGSCCKTETPCNPCAVKHDYKGECK